MILLQVAVPYCLDQLLSYIERQAERRNSAFAMFSEEARTSVLAIVPLLRHVIAVVHRCHLAAFYLRGIFYHVAKRIVGTHYVRFDIKFDYGEGAMVVEAKVLPLTHLTLLS